MEPGKTRHRTALPQRAASLQFARMVCVAAVALTVAVGCGDDLVDAADTPPTSGTTGDDSSDGANDGMDGTTGGSATDGTTAVQPGPVCTPGEVKGCSADNQAAVICNDAGDGWVSQQCLDDQGGNSWCNSALGCLTCRPLVKRCRTDEQPEICKEDGSGWMDDVPCNGATTGQVCDLGGSCVQLCALAEKWKSYLGCDYWGVDLDNAFVPGGGRGYYDAAGSQYAIVVSNPNENLPATVDVYRLDVTPDGERLPTKVTHGTSQLPFDTAPLQPGELRIYDLPRRDVDGTMQGPLAYRVQASVPITAYQFNPLENVDVFSNDASLLLPRNVLDRWYIVMTREQTFEILRSYLTIIAVQPGETQVTVRVTAPTLEGEGLPALKAGDTFVRTLQQYDVLNIETNRPGSDLTGSVVQATRPVAVFGGSEASNAPNTAQCVVAPGETEGTCAWDGESSCETPLDCLDFNTCCADHLEHQLYPVVTWGERYIAARSMKRGAERDVWRILAAEDNTVITTVPPQATLPVLNSGEWFEFESDGDFEIIATKPIFVGQFLAAQDAPDPNVNGIPQPDDAAIGDPAFIAAVPFEQYRTDYVFLAPNKYELDFITVTAPTGSEVRLDSEIIDPTQFSPIGTGEFSAARLAIEDGTHRLTSTDPVGVIVYGYDSYVSYGYAGGLDLQDLKLVTQPK
ncbi:MAG: IgGFc-binding protein [Myxococcota bacterium]|nr:IgGFc-binding protein [Myxococcota bacterium]